MVINSPEWDEMNRRRGRLIDKKYDEGLTAKESLELDRLQAVSLSIIEEEFPYPTVEIATEVESIIRNHNKSRDK